MNKPWIKNRNRKVVLPVQTTRVHIEVQNTQDWGWPGSCSGFVLDWLAGGDVCRRDIQGFSMRLEDLLINDARQATTVNQADNERLKARRN